MNKILIIAALFFNVCPVAAQKGMENLIQAEKDFAAYSVAHSTKEAFQKYIDSSSIMFDKGKPVKAIGFWNQREKGPGVLNWRPQFAEIAASGDFGYTTGPWTFQPTATDSVVARGQYITVWYLTKEGKWKFLADLGVDNTPVNDVEGTIKINAVKDSSSSKAITYVYPLVEAENDFEDVFKKNSSKAYKKYLAKASILTRNGAAPAVTAADQQITINATPPVSEYKMEGWGVSPVEDLGYTYGTFAIKDKKENFLRIWRRESGGWKIAVEVLRY